MGLSCRDARSRYTHDRAVVVKFLLSNGEYFKEKVLDFPFAQEFVSSKLLVACTDQDGKIMAVCGIRSLLNILVLYVQERYRNRGVGAQILIKMIRAVERRRLAFVTLSVSSNNRIAFHLYRKMGFRQVLFLRKSRQILMILPLSFVGKLAYAFFYMIRFSFPNVLVSYIHFWLYRRTLKL